MSDHARSHRWDSGHLRVGTALAWYYGETFGLEDPVLRIIRIALLTLIPALALGTFVAACSDDTTTVTTQDLSVVHDLSTPVVHDMAQPVD
jgi:hypothetical protein